MRKVIVGKGNRMAEFSVAAIFSDHMVLQRDKNVKIFGEGEDGDTVTVEFAGQRAKARVENGRWCAVLSPMRASARQEPGHENPDFSGDCFVGDTMTVACKGEVRTFFDVVIGEVWLAGGQSNMEMELRDCRGGRDFLANDKNPGVRFYGTPQSAYKDAYFYEREKASAWSTFGEERAKHWSAVGYFFAKRLAAELGVVVGVIGCNWGGSSASCWVDRETLARDVQLKSYLEDYEAAVAGKSEEEQIAGYREYEAYNAAWQKRAAVYFADGNQTSWEEVIKNCGEFRFAPMCCINPLRPVGLYECMLQRVMPYTLRGFLYYQGEADDQKPEMYERLLCELIAKWRGGWGNIHLPFLMVQLPMHRYASEPDNKNWCLLREAQMRVFESVKNTGLAVILEHGEFNEIHPKEKEAVGERLALQAMWLVYRLCTKKRAFGPVYRETVSGGNALLVRFECAEDGFVIRGDGAGFELAGADKKYVPAKAETIVGHADTLRLWADGVECPVYARYCWTNYGAVNYFGKNGLPMAPFRTSMQDET